MNRLMAKRIDHVGVLVVDADKACDTFMSEFGMSMSADWTDPDGRFRLLYLECGDTTLQLVQPLLQGSLMTHLNEHGEGLHHVCFEVGDVRCFSESIALALSGDPYLGGRGTLVCFLEERPHGLLVELTEGPSEASISG